MTDPAQRQPDGTFGIGNRASPFGRGARKRRAEQQAERDEAERKKLESTLVADFGRVPSAREAAALEMLSASLIQSRRLREKGQSDIEDRRLIVRLLKELGLKGAAELPQESDAEYLERTAREAVAS